jgi:hypothetical protein
MKLMRGFYCYTGNLVYLNHDKHTVSAQFSDAGPAWSTFTCQRFTRSRDALKSIRPSGWTFLCDNRSSGTDLTYYPPGLLEKYPSLSEIRTGVLPTEELAELHAIIQAITHERGAS